MACVPYADTAPFTRAKSLLLPIDLRTRSDAIVFPTPLSFLAPKSRVIRALKIQGHSVFGLTSNALDLVHAPQILETLAKYKIR